MGRNRGETMGVKVTFTITKFINFIEYAQDDIVLARLGFMPLFTLNSKLSECSQQTLVSKKKNSPSNLL